MHDLCLYFVSLLLLIQLTSGVSSVNVKIGLALYFDHRVVSAEREEQVKTEHTTLRSTMLRVRVMKSFDQF